MVSQTQGQGPWSSKDYRNGSDIESDAAMERKARLYGFAGIRVRLGESADVDEEAARTAEAATTRGAAYAIESTEPGYRKVAQAGGHFFLPSLIASAAGLSSDRLARVIAYSQFPDQNSAQDGYTNGTRALATTADYVPGQMGLLSERALHALNGFTTKQNLDFYQTVIAENRGDDAVLGIAVHGLVDSIFHSREDGHTFEAPIGHGAHGSEPDYVNLPKLLAATGQLIAAFETITGNELTRDQRDAAFGAVNAAWSRVAARSAEQIDEIQRSYQFYGQTPNGSSLSRGERDELNFRDIVREMVPKDIPNVRLEDLPSPFFRQPITPAGTADEGRTFWNSLPSEHPSSTPNRHFERFPWVGSL